MDDVPQENPDPLSAIDGRPGQEPAVELPAEPAETATADDGQS